MALSKTDAMALVRAVKQRMALDEGIESATKQRKALNDEITSILNRYNLKEVPIAGKLVSLASRTEWTTFDKEAFAAEYPYDEYPEMYEPSWKLARESLIHRHGRTRGRLIMARFAKLSHYVKIGTERPTRARKRWSAV